MNKTVKPFSPRQERFGRFVINLFGRWQVRVYRLTGGRLWNTFLGAPVAIFTITGRKSGKPRHVPLLYVRDGDNVVIAATQGGMSTYPIWYRNMLANPSVQCQIGSERKEYCVRRASEVEEVRLWPLLDSIYDGYAEYRARLAGLRDAPVMILEPRGGE